MLNCVAQSRKNIDFVSIIRLVPKKLTRNIELDEVISVESFRFRTHSEIDGYKPTKQIIRKCCCIYSKKSNSLQCHE